MQNSNLKFILLSTKVLYNFQASHREAIRQERHPQSRHMGELFSTSEHTLPQRVSPAGLPQAHPGLAPSGMVGVWHTDVDGFRTLELPSSAASRHKWKPRRPALQGQVLCPAWLPTPHGTAKLRDQNKASTFAG